VKKSDIYSKLPNCHITALYTTFQPAIKATRSVAAGWNVGEGGVGVKRPSRLNPEPPKGGEAYTSGYVTVGLKRIIS